VRRVATFSALRHRGEGLGLDDGWDPADEEGAAFDQSVAVGSEDCGGADCSMDGSGGGGGTRRVRRGRSPSLVFGLDLIGSTCSTMGRETKGPSLKKKRRGPAI
jgi:hypothetical protein